MTAQQLWLFGPPPEGVANANVRRRAARRLQELSTRTPVQKDLMLKIRKIAYKKRVYEDPNARNDFTWEEERIFRLHLVLLNDLEERFPQATLHTTQLEFWLWMCGDGRHAFSFQDCLVADGYTNPGIVVEACQERIPSWIRELHDNGSTIEEAYKVAAEYDAKRFHLAA
jgi:hypothetical protein